MGSTHQPGSGLRIEPMDAKIFRKAGKVHPEKHSLSSSVRRSSRSLVFTGFAVLFRCFRLWSRNSCRKCLPDVLPAVFCSVRGWVAQLAEQRTENPRVGGSIPSPATTLNCLQSGLNKSSASIPLQSQRSNRKHMEATGSGLNLYASYTPGKCPPQKWGRVHC